MRMNLVLGSAAASAAVVHLTSWGAANPLLLLGGLLVAGGTSAYCAFMLLLALRSGLTFGSRLEKRGSVAGVLDALTAYTARDLGTVGGLLLAALAVLSVVAAGQLLLGGASHVASAAAAAAAGLPVVPPAGLVYLHRLAAPGLLVLAGCCWALMEFASGAVVVDMVTATKRLLLQDMVVEVARSGAQREEQEGGAAASAAGASSSAAYAAATRCSAPPERLYSWRFHALHLGLLASLVLQALFLAQGGVAGAYLNGPDPMWALSFWSIFLGAAYLLVVAAVIDWGSIGALLWGMGSWVGGWISWASQALVPWRFFGLGT